MTGLPPSVALSVALSIDEHHPAFEGHFPSMPIVPGVVLLDQGLRAIAAHRRQCGDGGRAIDMQGIDTPTTDLHAADERVERCRLGSAKFLSFVRPGEPVRLEIESASSLTVDATGNIAFRLRIFAGPRGRRATGGDRQRLVRARDRIVDGERVVDMTGTNG